MTGNSKLRNWKLEARNSKFGNQIAAREFRISSFDFRVSSFEFRLSFLLYLILAATACNWFHPQRQSESDRHELAARFQKRGGGRWWRPDLDQTSHPLRHGQSSGVSLQVLATPAAYPAVLSRVQQESDKDHLDLRTSATIAGGLHAANPRCYASAGSAFCKSICGKCPRLLRAAIVIDDMGNDLEAAHKLLALDYPLTFSVLPYLRYTQTTAEEAHRSGHEVMLHLPMEPEPGAHASPGEGAILVGMNAAEVHRVVQNDLASVPYVAGVNNHMGSRATKDAALMADVMKTLADHRLYFIDSRTTAASMALDAARRQGLPAFYRAVFLDDTETVPYTLGQLREFRHAVEQEGVALAIGHPHATTIAALAKFLPELERADIELVAPSQIVRLPELARLHPPVSTN